MKRFWISWCYYNSDWDIKSFPSSVKNFWLSGGGFDFHCICAVIDAPSKNAAKRIVYSCWNKGSDNPVRHWRFCDEKPSNWMPGERFQS